MTEKRLTLEEFFDDTVDDAYAWAYRVVRNAADAEDAVMNAFVKMARLSWRSIEEPRAWLWSTIRNESIAVLRKRDRSTPTAQIEAVLTDLSTVRAIEQLDSLDSLRRAMLELPQRQRQALVLLFWDDLAYAEAATVMGITVSTLETHRERGLAGLARAFTSGRRSG